MSKTFDALRFVEDYGIYHSTQGKSVSRNFVGVKCPFCDDTGEHLGIHKTKGYTTCWLCGYHSLYDTLRELTGEDPKTVMEKYGTLLYSMETESYTPENRPGKVIVPGSRNYKKVHYDYLTKRGYDASYILRKYDVRVTTGLDPYPFRLIFPIVYNKRIVSYQGRTFINDKIKYLTCKPENEVMFHKDTFFNIDNATKESVLVVEGVFDAIRFGDNAIASFGTGITDSQLNLLITRYKRVFFLYDPEKEAQEKAHKALTLLNSCGIITEKITLDSGDPGDLTEDEALYIKRDLNLI